jgi:hypothetical protein
LLIRPGQAFIHIGLEKAGSTYIQDFIFLNRNRLAEMGLYVNPKLGLRNHSRLVLLGNSKQDPFTKIHKWYKVTLEALDDSNKSLLNDLKSSLSSPHSLLASSEFLSSILTQEIQVRRLEDRLQRIFQNLSIYVYVRKQEDLLVSRYSTAVLDGYKKSFPHASQNLKVPAAIDVLSIIERWRKVFGKRLEVMPFIEKSRPSDLVVSFLERMKVGCFSTSDFVWPQSKSNQRLSINALETVRRLNIEFGSVPRDTRPELLAFLSERTQHDPKFTSDIKTYRDMQFRFLKSNESVASYLEENERSQFLEVQEPFESQINLSLIEELLTEIRSTFIFCKAVKG